MSDSQDMNVTASNSKRETILLSAWETFAAYGFRRTSMQDIADKASISRPALYLEFANKADIFRGLAKSIFQQNIVNAKEIFETDAPLKDKLLKVLIISFADFYQHIENTPHGEEMLSIKTELAGDIYLDWLDEIKSTICDGISKENENLEIGNSGINADNIASIIINTMHGSKSRQTNEAELRKQAENVVTLVMAAMSQTN